MTTAAIDTDLLNELFDNQKKLDDIFNSMFDDDTFLNSPAKPALKKSQQPYRGHKDFSTNENDAFLAKKSQSLLHVVLPVAIEIVIISYSILYFN